MQLFRHKSVRGALAVAVLLGATTAVVVAEEVSLKQMTVILDDRTADADVVETLGAGRKVQVLSREGNWVHVRTPTGKEGWASKDAIAAGAGNWAAITGGPSASDMATAADRGLTPEAEAYAKANHYNPALVERMIDMGNKVKRADRVQFAQDGHIVRVKR